MLAFILGLPVVRPSWVDDCKYKATRVAYAPHYAWGQERGPWTGLRGLTAYVHCSDMLRKIKSLLEHAGASKSLST
jgi:hypothetical protein